MEARTVLGQLLERWPGLRLAEAVPRWGNKPTYRRLVALPLQHTTIRLSRPPSERIDS